MKKTIIILLAVFMVVAFASLGSAYERCPFYETESTYEDNNADHICPVLGDKADKDTPHCIEHRGRKAGFCYPGYVARSKADPERHMHHLRSECLARRHQGDRYLHHD